MRIGALKLSYREEILIFLAGLAVAFYLFYQLMYIPISDKVTDIDAKLRTTRRELELAISKIRVLKYLEQAKIELLPKETQVSRIYDFTAKSFRELGINLGSMNYSSSGNNLVIDLNCQADYDAFHKYLASLKDLKLPMRITAAAINMQGSLLDIKLTLVSTYI